MSKELNRRASFETFEPRLVMSAQALTDFVAQFPEAIETIDVDQRIETLSTTSNDTGFGSNDIESIREQYDLSGKGQTIAVIDSGIAYDHAAFGGGFGQGHRVVGGYDFAEDDANPYEDGPISIHGTHVAGIIGAETDTYSGVAPGADLVSLRVFDDNGAGDLAWVEQALQWVHDNRNAFENPITTVNLSIGTDWNADTIPDIAQLEDEFAQLEADGIFISVASGNLFSSYNSAGVSYPAASPFVVPIASHDADGNLSDFSQRNSNVLVAPGENILSTVPDHVFTDGRTDSYLRSTGTSQSAPFAAGASALLREALQKSGVQDIDQDLLYDHFRATADVVFDQVTGANYHRINLENAIQAALGETLGNQHTSSTDLGSINGNEVIHGEIEAAIERDNFSFVANRTGQISFAVSGQDGFIPEFTTTHGAVQNGNRITFEVHAGQEYQFAIGSSSGTGVYSIDVEFTGTNSNTSGRVFLDSTGRLVVTGSNQNDQVAFRYGDSITVELNGQQHQFNSDDVNSVAINALAGNDQLFVIAQREISHAILDGSNLAYSGPAFQFISSGFESIDLTANGTADLLVVRDTTGHDFIEAGIGYVNVSSDNGAKTVSGFDSIVVNATDGHDRIRLVGSQQDDRFVSQDGRNVLRNQSGRIVANDFERVVAIGNGGNDTALLRGSADIDQYDLAGKQFAVSSTNNEILGSGFEKTVASTEQAGDRLSISGSDSAETLIHRSDRTRFGNEQFLNFGFGFSDIFVNAGGGNDTARVFDSAHNDHFSAGGIQFDFENSHQMINGTGFETITAISENGGYDRAVVVGSGGADILDATSNRATLTDGSGNVITVRNFQSISADTLGGMDTTILRGSDQRDLLRSLNGQVEFESTMQMLRIINSESTSFDGGQGNDEVLIDHFDSLDLLEAVGDRAVAYLNSNEIRLSNIEFLEAKARAGALPDYDISAVDFLFLLDGNWEQAD